MTSSRGDSAARSASGGRISRNCAARKGSAYNGFDESLDDYVESTAGGYGFDESDQAPNHR